MYGVYPNAEQTFAPDKEIANVPDVVMGPPVTEMLVPVAFTQVTVPVHDVRLLKLFQSEAVNKPVQSDEAVAMFNDMVPEDVTGEHAIDTPAVEDVRPTLVTVPVQPVWLLNVFQSAAVSKPVHTDDAVETLIPSVPLDVIGLPVIETPVVDVHAATFVTVPVQVV